MAATIQELRQLIEDAGLGRVADDLVRLAEPSIRAHTRPADDEALPIGVSKLGGVPDLPLDMLWPMWNEKPLTFICQLDLREVADHDMEHDLPSAGVLSFFYEADEQPWGFDPKDRGGWRVLYFPPDMALHQASVPPEVVRLGQFQACSVEYTEEWTVPDLASGVERLRDLTDDEMEAYFDLDITLYHSRPGLPDDTSLSRLLGHSQHVQGEMRLECQLASQGVYCGDADSYRSEAAQALALGASDWRLLLQVDSDSNAEMMWGDCGRLYYWIRQQDLAARNFGAVWVVLQCG